MILGGLSGGVSALGGTLLVLRRQAMLADAVSHAILPGLVLGALLVAGSPLWAALLGAVVAGVLTVVLVQVLERSLRVAGDAAIGLVFPLMFALGVLMVSGWVPNSHIDADAVLYGELVFAPLDRLVSGGRDLGPVMAWSLGGVALLNALFLRVFWKELTAETFDRSVEKLRGSKGLGWLTLVVLSATIVVSFSAVGAVMAVAQMVIPAAVALLLTRRLGWVYPIAMGVGAGCGAVGVLVAWGPDLSLSGAIVGVLGAVFGAAVLFAPERGLVSGVRRRARQRRRLLAAALAVHLRTHAGTGREEVESLYGHLLTELGWTAAKADLAVREATLAGWVQRTGARLELTEAGDAFSAGIGG